MGSWGRGGVRTEEMLGAGFATTSSSRLVQLQVMRPVGGQGYVAVTDRVSSRKNLRLR